MKDDWYKPLLDKLWEHMLTQHNDVNISDHATEYQFTEEFLHYESFRDGEPRSLPCPWANCTYCIEYVPVIELGHCLEVDSI